MQSAFGVPVRLVPDTDAADPDRQASGLMLPLVGASGRFGHLLVDTVPPSNIEPAQRELLEAHALQLTVAFDRAAASAAQRTAELEVEQERMRSSLLRPVSHDLRTPLGVILGATTSLLDPAAEPPVAQRLELLQTIHGEAMRLSRLLENLLQMTRIEGGALVVEKDWHVPEEVVDSALRRVAGSTDDRELEVRVHREPSLVEMDGLLIEVVLINLVENAVKHTAPGTKLEIVAQQHAHEYVFDVRDERPGISAGQVERLFEKFQRGADGGGAGLGLAICRAIARAHGGDVLAVSRDPRPGLSMQLRLPFRDAPAEDVAAVS
jgi:two-component system sensor histidine kinase KdpD